MKQVEIQPNMSVTDLTTAMKSGGFTCRKVGKAIDLWIEMVEDTDCTKILGISGALIPGGMRKVITKLIQNDVFDSIVTTGAQVSHDLMEAFGGKHLHGDTTISDVKLAEMNLSRIYTTLIPYNSFAIFEKMMQSILKEIPDSSLSTSSFLKYIGSKISDKDSFVKAAYDKSVPIFSPSFVDSMLGVQTWLFSQTNKFSVDVLKDHSEFSNIIYEAKNLGALILGGGVPKHFILNASQLNDGLTYGIQITMDRPEHGGVSGASMKEAISWGKLSKKAKWIDIMSDITLVLPLMSASLITQLKDRSEI